MEEYEYSFKVKDIKPFIDYCLSHEYIFEDEYEQIRILYKNGGKVMARITRNCSKDGDVEILNFKEDNPDDNILKVSRESKDLLITDENREFVKSLLEILELREEKKLSRKRFVYKKDKVVFEIDRYTEPKMNVVAIEGNKDEVNSVYKTLKRVIAKNIFNK